MRVNESSTDRELLISLRPGAGPLRRQLATGIADAIRVRPPAAAVPAALERAISPPSSASPAVSSPTPTPSSPRRASSRCTRGRRRWSSRGGRPRAPMRASPRGARPGSTSRRRRPTSRCFPGTSGAARSNGPFEPHRTPIWTTAIATAARSCGPRWRSGSAAPAVSSRARGASSSCRASRRASTSSARRCIAAGKRRFAIEDPALRDAVMTARQVGLEIIPVPVDADGIDVAALARTQADAVLVTPAHQFPTGVVLTPERRRALLDWARATDGARDRGRLRRRVPSRRSAGRGLAGPRTRSRRLHRHGLQDARTRPSGSAGSHCRNGSPARGRRHQVVARQRLAHPRPARARRPHHDPARSTGRCAVACVSIARAATSSSARSAATCRRHVCRAPPPACTS